MPRQDSQDNEAYQGVSANDTSLTLAGVTRSGRPLCSDLGQVVYGPINRGTWSTAVMAPLPVSPA
jgi:hypothetical protein